MRDLHIVNSITSKCIWYYFWRIFVMTLYYGARRKLYWWNRHAINGDFSQFNVNLPRGICTELKASTRSLRGAIRISCGSSNSPFSASFVTSYETEPNMEHNKINDSIAFAQKCLSEESYIAFNYEWHKLKFKITKLRLWLAAIRTQATRHCVTAVRPTFMKESKILTGNKKKRQVRGWTRFS